MKLHIALAIIAFIFGFGAGFTVYALSKEKLKFVRDGKVEGWTFMTIGTLGLYGSYLTCFYSDRAINVMDKLGYQMIFAWSSMMFIWGGLKTARKIWGKIPGVPYETSASLDAIADELESEETSPPEVPPKAGVNK